MDIFIAEITGSLGSITTADLLNSRRTQERRQHTMEAKKENLLQGPIV